jgi:16S rRNA (cytosine967-C5)-methyltransferase
MRIHRILAQAAARIVDSVFEQGKVLDYQLAKAFEAHPKWGKRDRGFVAETVFEVIRWRRALSFVVDSPDTDALCAAQWLRMGYELPAWWTYRGASVESMLPRQADLLQQPRAIRESIPDWLDTLGQQELGINWDAELTALNSRSRVYLRVNTLRTTRPQAIEWLASHNVIATAVPQLPDALVLPPGKTIAKTLHRDGRVEIQDAGSQMIAPLLAAAKGQHIIDCCAGAGGKTVHLAALVHNKARITAMDIAPKKLAKLMQRAKRAKASSSIQTREINAQTLQALNASADRLLIDAPCSGLGTLKRQPDLKWRITAEQFNRVRNTQSELLASYTSMLKPGGRLVYATCSLLPSENRHALQQLLDSGQWQLEEECSVSPAATGFDGFYAAALIKRPAPE